MARIVVGIITFVVLLVMTILVSIKGKKLASRAQEDNTFHTSSPKGTRIAILVFLVILTIGQLFLMVIPVDFEEPFIPWLIYGIFLFLIFLFLIIYFQICLSYESISGDKVIIRRFIREKEFLITDIKKCDYLANEIYFFDQNNKAIFSISRMTIGFNEFISYLEKMGMYVPNSIKLILRNKKTDLSPILLDANIEIKKPEAIEYTPEEKEKITIFGSKFKRYRMRTIKEMMIGGIINNSVIATVLLLFFYLQNNLVETTIILLVILCVVIVGIPILAIVLARKKSRLSDFEIGEDELKANRFAPSNKKVQSVLVMGIPSIVLSCLFFIASFYLPVFEIPNYDDGTIEHGVINQINKENGNYFIEVNGEEFVIFLEYARYVDKSPLIDTLQAGLSISYQIGDYWYVEDNEIENSFGEIIFLEGGGETFLSKKDFEDYHWRQSTLKVVFMIAGSVLLVYGIIAIVQRTKTIKYMPQREID